MLVLVDSSENILWDSIRGLGFAIAFYYAITALASPIRFRKVLMKSWKHFVFAGVLPVLSALTLMYVFVRSLADYWNPANSYTPAWFAFGDFQGVGPALVIGIGSLLLGIPLMFWWKAVSPSFFHRKAEAAGTIDGLPPDPDRITDTDELTPPPVPAAREPSRT